MKILLTGHTGFKGSWLTVLLAKSGHEVWGLALPEEFGSTFQICSLRRLLEGEFLGDIASLDFGSLPTNFDLVIHMAAEALVLRGSEMPLSTFATNAFGTLRLLEWALSAQIPEVLVITTDKVYENNAGRSEEFSERDTVGGSDPYSLSKTISDLASTLLGMTTGMAGSKTKIVVARGGNVIGGGDISRDRLIPDIERALRNQSRFELRNPRHTRPWQHVLDCLAGYIAIANNSKVASGSAWNVGPSGRDSSMSVMKLVEHYSKARGRMPTVAVANLGGGLEKPYLALDSSKLRSVTGYRPKLSTRDAISWTAEWFRLVEFGSDPFEVMEGQIQTYLDLGVISDF